MGIATASAQTESCDGWLAELSRGPDPRAQEYVLAAQRQNSELQRTRNYFNQIGCGQQFGSPATCEPLRAHMQQMQANLRQMQDLADRLGGGPRYQERRRQLQAAVDRHCVNRPARPRGLLDRLFGDSQYDEQPMPESQSPLPQTSELVDEMPSGGSRPVCVRQADGYFFPLGGPFRGTEHAQQLCQAQCPASPTELFFMQQGGTIERAQSARGMPYSVLPAASRYQKTLDPAAACVPAGMTWEQALQGAASLLSAQDGDIVVTAEKADELSRPKASAIAAQQRANNARNQRQAEESEDTLNDLASVPTAVGESSGIGPSLRGSGPAIARQDGPTIITKGVDGRERKVRVVAPYLIATPDATSLN